MKKTFAILTIVVVLAMAFSLVFTSCGEAGGSTQEIDIAADHDYTQIENNLNDLKQDGIFVKVHVKTSGIDDDGDEVDEETNFAYGAKGDIYFFQYGEAHQQIYLDLSNEDHADRYDCSLDFEDLVWTKTVTYYDNDYFTKDSVKETAELAAQGIWMWFGYYRASSVGEGKKTSVTFLNRACDKYEMTANYGGIGSGNGIAGAIAGAIAGKVQVTQEVVIDKLTGVCLKYTMVGSYSGVAGLASGSVSIEATEFNTRWNPTLPEVDEEHTTINGGENGGGVARNWDLTLFALAGLDGELPEPNGEAQGAAYYPIDAENETDGTYNTFYIVSGNKATVRSQIEDLIQAFFNAGAKYDKLSETVCDSWNDENLLYQTSDSYMFSAAVGETGSVSISCNYVGNQWYVSVTATINYIPQD